MRTKADFTFICRGRFDWLKCVLLHNCAQVKFIQCKNSYFTKYMPLPPPLPICTSNIHCAHNCPHVAQDPALIWLIAFKQISGDMATEHINGNGPEEPMDTSAAVTHSEHFQTLLEAGLPQKVAEKLDEIYIAGKTKWMSLYIHIRTFCWCKLLHVLSSSLPLWMWELVILKQLFVVSSQNGYCSAKKNNLIDLLWIIAFHN